MKRKDFIKKTIAAGIAGVATPSLLQASNAKSKQSSYDESIKQVGFNHLPNKEDKTMNTVLHKAATRGHANHGWLDSHHTFSFANYYNPERTNFGVLRVLNDDKVAPGMGFGTHPHDNMEIISIPIEGDLKHKDSMGNTTIIKEGDIQVMSAGTGVFHSEYNSNKDREVKFLQIWVFPNKKQVEPRYDQIPISDLEKKNQFTQVLSPNVDDQGVWIHQDAWFSIGSFEKGAATEYTFNKTGNGVYLFVLEGEVKVGDQELSKRDGYGIWDTSSFNLTASAESRVLLMEVPMSL